MIDSSDLSVWADEMSDESSTSSVVSSPSSSSIHPLPLPIPYKSLSEGCSEGVRELGSEGRGVPRVGEEGVAPSVGFGRLAGRSAPEALASSSAIVASLRAAASALVKIQS